MVGIGIGLSVRRERREENARAPIRETNL